jgi:hypothetical protein
VRLLLEGVYVNLLAARCYDNAGEIHLVRAAVREYEEQLAKDERISVVARCLAHPSPHLCRQPPVTTILSPP